MTPDQDPNVDSAKRTLSEISHLFLSDVRDRHTCGAPRPQRVPPGQRDPADPIDPEGHNSDAILEGPNSGFASSDRKSAEPEVAPAPPVSALIAAHFGGGQSVRTRQYARHLAARIGRVGLIEIDGRDVRITCFEAEDVDAGTGLRFDGSSFPESVVDDPRALADAIEELDWDVRQWLLAPSNLRDPLVRSLLADVAHWALLTTCDHDGVVSSYRALKGLSDAVHDSRPLLTLSLLDAASEPEMARVFGKLSGVCQQFLDWPVQPEPAVVPAPGVTENPALFFHSGTPSAERCGPWSVLADLVARANSPGPEPVAPGSEMRAELATDAVSSTPFAFPTQAAPSDRAPAARHIADNTQGSASRPSRAMPTPTFTPVPTEPAAPSTEATDSTGSPQAGLPRADSEGSPRASAPQAPTPRPSNGQISSAEEFEMNEQPRMTPKSAPAAAIFGSGASRLSPEPGEVLEISAEGTAESILAAILSRPECGLVECPVRPPMCPSARLTIDRDRRVILLAVAREGLAELRSIGQAYRWLIENRALIGMAVPQLAIDAHRFPRLRLLVDPADASADTLQSMLQSGHVTVQAYRRVRWGNRTGLLLDAA